MIEFTATAADELLKRSYHASQMIETRGLDRQAVVSCLANPSVRYIEKDPNGADEKWRFTSRNVTAIVARYGQRWVVKTVHHNGDKGWVDTKTGKRV